MRRVFVSFLGAVSLALACATHAQSVTVPLSDSGGTFVVPVVINNQITLNFTLDSGASDVSIPADVFSTLVRTGTINESDYLGTQVYELADGTRTRSHRVRIRSLRVGSLELRNVEASVAPAAGSLLLGQSFLGRLGTWAIDNRRQVLVINGTGDSQSEQVAYQPPTSTSMTAPQAGKTDVQTDIWYECMKRHEWRDDANAVCSAPSSPYPSASTQAGKADVSADTWYQCMKLHQWRDDANAACSNASSPYTPDEETRQWLLRPAK
jgi:clan AA aspartic protease (TIGR02281 family)